MKDTQKTALATITLAGCLRVPRRVTVKLLWLVGGLILLASASHVLAASTCCLIICKDKTDCYDDLTLAQCNQKWKDKDKKCWMVWQKPAECANSSCKAVTKHGTAKTSLTPTGDLESPMYNTGPNSACGGRQFLAYNYAADDEGPVAPVLACVDSSGNPIATLHTVRVTNSLLLDDIMQLYQDSGFLAPNDTIVAWAFGTVPQVGSFPGTFCYSNDEFYGFVSTGNAVPLFRDSSTMFMTWYSSDTTSVSDTADALVTVVIKSGVPVPDLTGWGIVILILLLLATGSLIILRRRKAVKVRI